MWSIFTRIGAIPELRNFCGQGGQVLELARCATDDAIAQQLPDETRYHTENQDSGM